MSQVWVLDDDKSIRWVFEKALAKANITFECFSNTNEAINKFNHEKPQAIISDIRMPGESGIEFLTKVKNKFPEIPIIIMTAYSDLDTAVTAFQKGAFEYIAKPFDINKVISIIEQALESISKKIDNEELGELPEIIGQAKSMQDVFRAIGRLSQSNAMVLLNGESGSGKELVAKAIHKNSHRKNNEFIAINTAAIPNDLLEAELFGFEKGAFTGASAQRKGKFEQASQGTLFLDEIGDMPIDLQTRLLRVLSEGQFYRVGGQDLISVDVRVIAATHQDLEVLVKSGQFREDLFHRLNVIRIPLPNLNQRSEDIPALARHFLVTSAKELAVETKILSSAAAAHLQTLDWPGNVRQLENVCRWLSVMGSGNQILESDLPPELQAQTAKVSVQDTWQEALARWSKRELQLNQQPLLDKALPAFETVMIQEALKHTHGRRREAAQILGWGRNTLTRKINELGL